MYNRKKLQQGVLGVLQEAYKQNLISMLDFARLSFRVRWDKDLSEKILNAVTPIAAAYDGCDECTFGRETPNEIFQIDIEQLDQILALILKYLPQIIALFVTV